MAKVGQARDAGQNKVGEKEKNRGKREKGTGQNQRDYRLSDQKLPQPPCYTLFLSAIA